MWSTLRHSLALLGTADWRIALAAVAIYWVGAVAVAMRWRAMLMGLSCPVRLRDTLLANLAFTFVNNVTPGRVGGELLRVAVLRGRVPLDIRRAAASSLYDRLVDMAQLPLFVLLALPALPLLTENLRRFLSRLPLHGWARGLAAAAFVALAAWVLVRRAPRLRFHLKRLRDGLAALAVPRRWLATAAGWACLVWVLDATRLIVVALAFGVSLSPSQAVALSLAGNAGTAVPVMGGLGAVEGSLTATLCLFGVGLQTALAIALLERAISYAMSTVAGGIALLAMGGGRLLRAVKSSPPASPDPDAPRPSDQ